MPRTKRRAKNSRHGSHARGKDDGCSSFQFTERLLKMRPGWVVIATIAVGGRRWITSQVIGIGKGRSWQERFALSKIGQTCSNHTKCITHRQFLLSCVLGGTTLSSHHLMRWYSSRRRRTRLHPAWHYRPGSVDGTRPRLAQVLRRTVQSVALLTPRTARQWQRRARR